MGIQELENFKNVENIFRGILTENFSNLGKDTTVHVQEGQMSPVRFSPTNSTARHVTVKLSEVNRGYSKLQEKRCK